MQEPARRYKGYRYSIEIIQHAVYLYHRFTVSLRDVEEMLLYRGIVVSYETIRGWGLKFGQDYAASRPSVYVEAIFGQHLLINYQKFMEILQ